LIASLLLVSSLLAGCGTQEPKSIATPSSAKKEGFPPLTPVNGTGQLASNSASSFSFAVFGDNQGDQKADQTAGTMFKAISSHQPQTDFAFELGDIIEGKDPNDPDTLIQQKYNDYIALVKTMGMPVFNAPGNHEMDDSNDVPNERMHQLYQESVAPLFGAFDYGNSRFIALNTEDVPAPGQSIPAVPQGYQVSYIDDAQLQQLDADLAANTDKAHVFIMMHYPVKPMIEKNSLNPDSLQKLTGILAKYDNVSFVLASHEHLFYNPQDPSNLTSIAPFKAGDPTVYLVSGGAGAKISETPQNGGFNHYLIFNIDGDNVSVTINRLDG